MVSSAADNVDSSYQLFITLGILIAECINYGTEARPNPQSWRIPMGISFLWSSILGIGIILMPEAPRYAYRKGNVNAAKRTMTRLHGVPANHVAVVKELGEIKKKLDAERAEGPVPWYEFFTGPSMAYRTILGVTLQALQQLTGANFFFYYGTR